MKKKDLKKKIKEWFMKRNFKWLKIYFRLHLNLFKWILVILLSSFLFYLLIGIFKNPDIYENKKVKWEFGQEKLATIEIHNGSVLIKNLRDFNWINNFAKYKNFKFNLKDIESVDLLISHFSKKEFVAHVFVIFNLENKKNFGVSIESRRIEEEKFSILGGMWYRYNLIYVFATEKDLLELRKKRKEKIYRYNLLLNSQEAQKLFVKLAEKENRLLKKPEFYNTILDNCTNLLIEEMQKVKKFDFPFLEKYFLPGYIDKALYDEKMLDKTNSFQSVWKEYKKQHLIIQ